MENNEMKMILERFDRIDSKMSEMDGKISALDTKVSNMDGKVFDLDKKVTSMDIKMSEIDDKVSDLNKKVLSMDIKMSETDGKVSSIQLAIEDEIRNNIQILAEGHMTLERKLDESLKVNHEKELLLIRVNKLETEVRELKENIEKIS